MAIASFSFISRFYSWKIISADPWMEIGAFCLQATLWKIENCFRCESKLNMKLKHISYEKFFFTITELKFIFLNYEFEIIELNRIFMELHLQIYVLFG